MEKIEYSNIFKHESKHFFYVSTHSLVLDLARKWTKGKQSLEILDAGCGTGLLLKKLKKLGKAKGVDYNPEAIKLARKRNVEVKKASINKLPFKKILLI